MTEGYGRSAAPSRNQPGVFAAASSVSAHRLAQTLANGQTAVLDEMRAIRGQLAQLCSRDTETLREQLRDIRALQDRIDTRLRTSENGLASLTAASTSR